jgi:CRP/FNR family transcriptional regulator
MNETELLKYCLFTERLTEEQQQLLVSSMAKVRYSKGERMIKAGEFVTHAVFVIKGYVKIHSEVRGKAVIVNIIGSNCFAGLSTMLSEDKNVLDITALEDTTACLINIEVLRGLIEKNGMFAKGIIEYMNKTMLHYLQHNIVALTQCNIHGRLANTLLYLAQEVFLSNSFDLLLSRVELSQLSNISRENVIKVLYEFSSDGVIKINGKHIQVLNLEQLKRLADTC